MAHSLDYKRGYAAGYNAGARGRWHEHRPPVPPEPIVAELIKALQKLRDGVDTQLAAFDPEDPIEAHLGPLVDDADEALTAVSLWLKSKEPTP